MEITRDNILEILYESIAELNEQRSKEQQLACCPQTLLGEGAGLDSLGFVNLVALVEEKCEERFGKTIVISDVLASAPASARDPFETVSSLAEYIARGLTDRSTARR